MEAARICPDLLRWLRRIYVGERVSVTKTVPQTPSYISKDFRNVSTRAWYGITLRCQYRITQSRRYQGRNLSNMSTAVQTDPIDYIMNMPIYLWCLLYFIVSPLVFDCPRVETLDFEEPHLSSRRCKRGNVEGSELRPRAGYLYENAFQLAPVIQDNQPRRTSSARSRGTIGSPDQTHPVLAGY